MTHPGSDAISTSNTVATYDHIFEKNTSWRQTPWMWKMKTMVDPCWLPAMKSFKTLQTVHYQSFRTCLAASWCWSWCRSCCCCSWHWPMAKVPVFLVPLVLLLEVQSSCATCHVSSNCLFQLLSYIYIYIYLLHCIAPFMRPILLRTYQKKQPHSS